MAPEDQLGLILFYFGSTMTMILCMIFGITPSVCSRALWHMLKRIVKTLQFHPWSRVKFPDVKKMREYAAMVQARDMSLLSMMSSASWTVSCFFQSAVMSGWNKMHFTVAMTQTQW